MIDYRNIPTRFKNTIIGLFQIGGVTPRTVKAASFGIVYPNLEAEGRGLGFPNRENALKAEAELDTNPRGYAKVALQVYNRYLTETFASAQGLPQWFIDSPRVKDETDKLIDEELNRLVPEGGSQETVETSGGTLQSGKVCPFCNEVHTESDVQEITGLKESQLN